MIQRVQSIFLFLATISVIVIVFNFPILINNDNNIATSAFDISSIRWLLTISAGLSFFAFFQYKSIKRQQFLSRLSRFIITITLVLIVFIYKDESNNIGLGFFLLLIPFLLLIGANYFLAKDERLIKDADRLR